MDWLTPELIERLLEGARIIVEGLLVWAALTPTEHDDNVLRRAQNLLGKVRRK